jgi:surfeit locus 1 family protein
MSGGSVVLVERGWVGSPDARVVDLERLAEPETTVVEGVLFEASQQPVVSAQGAQWPRTARTADPKMIEDVFPGAVFPLFLRRTVLPAAAPSAFRVVPLPELTDGPHLSYAIQWLAFGIIAAVGGVLLYVKRER